MRKLFCQVHFRALKSVYTIKNKRVGSLYHRTRSYASAADALPRVVHPSFWQLIVPKFIRERKRNAGQIKDPKSREWNPATFYIVIFLLIGSNAIQMIALRNDYAVFSRKADAKISLLKEVLERVHRGEDVDVKGLLGTGDEEQEKEWEEVLREIVEEQRVTEKKPRRTAEKIEHSVSQNAKANTNKIHTNDLTVAIEASDETGYSARKEEETRENLAKRPFQFY